MTLRVFYWFAASEREVSSARPVEMERPEIAHRLAGELQGEDDFIGILDARDVVLQVLYRPREGRYWVEIPFPDERASWGKLMDEPDLTDFLEDLPERFPEPAFPGFERTPW